MADLNEGFLIDDSQRFNASNDEFSSASSLYFILMLFLQSMM